MGQTNGGEIGLYQCHYQSGSQGWMFNNGNFFSTSVLWKSCMVPQGNKLVLAACSFPEIGSQGPAQQLFSTEGDQVKVLATPNLCLERSNLKNPPGLILATCSNSSLQKFHFLE